MLMSLRLVADERVFDWASYITTARRDASIDGLYNAVPIFRERRGSLQLLTFPQLSALPIQNENRATMHSQAALFGLFSLLSLTYATKSLVQFVIDQFPPCLVRFHCRWAPLHVLLPETNIAKIVISNLVNVPAWQRTI